MAHARLRPALASFAVAMTLGSIAHAAPQTDADRLFGQALQELDQGHWERACPKFRQSMQADPAVGTLLNVAACSDHEGRPLEALEQYREVLRLNASTVDPKRRASVEASALDAIRLLERRIPSLLVRVEPPTANVSIDGQLRHGGEQVQLASGGHQVRVTAEGYAPETRAIQLAEAEHASIEVALVRVPGPSTTTASDGVLAPAGWVVGGVGVAAAIGGAALIGLAATRASEIEDECGVGASPPRCDGDAARANALSTEGEAFRNAGVSLLVVGAAAAATAAVLLAVASADGDEAVAIAPMLTPEGGAVWARIVF